MKTSMKLLLVVLSVMSLYFFRGMGDCPHSMNLAIAAWDVLYRADELPQNAVPKWEVDKGFGGQDMGEIIDDPDHEGNKILHINDDGGGGRQIWLMPFEGEGTPKGITIVARIKTSLIDPPNEGDQERNIGWSDGVHPSDEVTIWPDRIQLGVGLPIGETPQKHNLDGTQWHTYRVTVAQGMAEVYVDEISPPVLKGQGTIRPDHWRALHLVKLKDEEIGPAVAIGVAQSFASQDIFYDYVLIDFSGAHPPSGDFPAGLIREYLAVESRGKSATQWGEIKSFGP